MVIVGRKCFFNFKNILGCIEHGSKIVIQTESPLVYCYGPSLLIQHVSMLYTYLHVISLTGQDGKGPDPEAVAESAQPPGTCSR